MAKLSGHLASQRQLAGLWAVAWADSTAT